MTVVLNTDASRVADGIRDDLEPIHTSLMRWCLKGKHLSGLGSNDRIRDDLGLVHTRLC